MSLISHSATVLPVVNVAKAAAYYEKQLGFTITFSWESPPTYAVLKRDDALSIHLVQREDQGTPSKHHPALYIFTHDVDALYAEFQPKGVKIVTPIGNRDYGMRDFDIEDLDGHRLVFGQETP